MTCLLATLATLWCLCIGTWQMYSHNDVKIMFSVQSLKITMYWIVNALLLLLFQRGEEGWGVDSTHKFIFECHITSRPGKTVILYTKHSKWLNIIVLLKQQKLTISALCPYSSQLKTTTTVACSRSFQEDRIWLNGKEEDITQPRLQSCLRESESLYAMIWGRE